MLTVHIRSIIVVNYYADQYRSDGSNVKYALLGLLPV